MCCLVWRLLCFFLFLHYFLFSYHAIRAAWLKVVISLAAALYYLLVSFVIGYWDYTGDSVDFFFFTDSFTSITSTAVGIFGWELALYIPAFLALGIFYFTLFMRMFHSLRKIEIRYLSVAFLVLIIFVTSEFSISYASETPTGYISFHVQEALKTIGARHSVFTIFPDNSHYSTQSSENVFIVQLESGNALAVNGNLTIDGIAYDETYNPKMREIAKDGIYIPYFWGNSIQTNRAQENILCGMTGNLKEAFSYRPNELNVTCLPEILNKANYTTLFFRSDDIEFANTGNFMKHLGFKEIHYDDIMKDDDVKFRWGYDDCRFYTRVFEYLKENYPDSQKLFVYIEVSSHHHDFESKNGYE